MVADSRRLARTASSAPPVDLRRLLGYVGDDPLGGAAGSRPASAHDEARLPPSPRAPAVPCPGGCRSHCHGCPVRNELARMIRRMIVQYVGPGAPDAMTCFKP